MSIPELPAAAALSSIPDNLTITQLLLDGEGASGIRPSRPEGVPWLIEEETGREFGLEEIRRRVYGLANGLASRWKIGDSDVVCIFSPNHLNYPTAIWASHRLSAVPFPANPTYNPSELLPQLTLSKSTLLFAHSSTLHTAREAAAQAGISEDRVVLIDGKGKGTLESLIEDGLMHEPSFVECRLRPGESRTKLAYLCFSSGTTGKPKAVAIPHSSVLSNVIQFAAFYRMNEDHAPEGKKMIAPGDKVLLVVPLYNIYGLFLTLHMVLFSGLSVVINTTSKFNSTQILESIQRHKITHLPVIPPQIVLMCKHPSARRFDLSSVRMIMSGGAPLSGVLTARLQQLLPGASIGQVYGMTECGFCAMQPPSKHFGTLGSAGQFFPGVKVKVVKVDGTLAGFGEPGELYVGGPQIALRYEDNDQATKETWLDGWIRTGDEVIINENEDLFVRDRLKEVMKVKGFQVAPTELEDHLLDHSDIADACVVGIPDEYSGELPFAFIVLKPKPARRVKASAEEAEKVKAAIVKHASHNIVSYKWLLGGITFVDDIPRNPSGKMLRRVLREKARKMKMRLVL